MKRLPTDRQLDAIIGSIERLDLKALRSGLQAAIAHERRHPADVTGYRGGNQWTSSTEAAAIANVTRHNNADPQRAALERTVERLVRGAADIVQAQHDLTALLALQGNTGASQGQEAAA